MMKVCYTGWTWIKSADPEVAKEQLAQSFRECKFLGYDYVENYYLNQNYNCAESLLRAANASIATTTSGCVSSTTPLTISSVSIPVCAITPGTIPLTIWIFSFAKAALPYSRTT